MSQALSLPWIDFSKMLPAGQHLGIFCPTGGGKTHTLFVLVMGFYERECILWRDDSKLDFLSLLPKLKVRAFIPEGAEFQYSHPNLEIVEFNPAQIRTTLLDNLVRSHCINAVVYDRFNWFPERFVGFWNKMFYELWMWKNDPANIKIPITFVIDELADLIPSRDLALLESHRLLAARIVFNIRKYRSQGIRFIGTAHHYSDLHGGVKGNFMFSIFKRTARARSLPEEIQDYSPKIEKLKKEEAFVYSEGYQQVITVPDLDPEIRPRKGWEVATKPPHGEVESAGKADKRFACLLTTVIVALQAKGWSMDKIAKEVFQPYYSGPSAIAQHLKRYPEEEARSILRKRPKAG